MTRYFHAIDIPSHTKVEIQTYADSLKTLFDTNAIKWSPLENYHVTLKFWGNQNDDDIEKIKEKSYETIKAHAPLTLDVSACFCFDTRWQGSIIALKIVPSEALLRLAFDLGKEPPYLPHITLGRARQKIESAPNFPPIQFTLPIDTVTLFSSDTQEKQSIYTTIEIISL